MQPWLLVCAAIAALSLVTAPVATRSEEEIREAFGELFSERKPDVRAAKRKLSQRSPLLAVHAEEAHKRLNGFLGTTSESDLSLPQASWSPATAAKVTELAGYVATLSEKGFAVLESSVYDNLRTRGGQKMATVVESAAREAAGPAPPRPPPRPPPPTKHKPLSDMTGAGGPKLLRKQDVWDEKMAGWPCIMHGLHAGSGLPL